MKSPNPAVRPSVKLARAAGATAGVTLGVVAGAVLAGGCVGPREQPVPFDPARLHAAERAAASELEFRRLPAGEEPARTDRGFLDVEGFLRDERRRGPQADTGFGPEPAAAADAPADEAPVRLPLSEAVRRAALNNFDVAVAAFEPAIEGTRQVEAVARFDPTFRQRIEGRYADRQIAGQLIDAATIVQDLQRVYSSSSAIVQALPSGGQAELRYDVTVLDSPSSFQRGLTTLEQTVESAVVLRLTQPLLRDFGRDVNRARIAISENTRRAGVLDFRRRLEETLVEVEQAYWQLYQAQQEVEIQTDLLERTIATAEAIAARLGIDANQGQVAQANRFVSERRATLIQAEARAAVLGDRLKLLMNDADMPVAGRTQISAVTPPVDAPLLFDFDEALETALVLRPEIAQQLTRVQSADVALRVGRNNVLPRLDLIVETGFQGLEDDYFGAVESQFAFDNITAGLGVQFEVPLGNRAARSVLRRAVLQRQQAVVGYASLVQQATFDLKQAQQNLSANYAVLAERRRAVDSAGEAVRVEEETERDGALTPAFSDRKLRFLDDLARSRSLEAEALATYNVSLALFERAKGTLLRYNNITIGETDLSAGVPTGRPVVR